MYQPSSSRALAAQGANDYSRTLCESREARALFLSGYFPQKPIRILDVQRCFVGISAEIVFEERDIATNPRYLFQETTSYINGHLANFLFYHSPTDRYHLFNLEAVRLLATRYPAYFPVEAGTDSRAWLQHNWQIWADGNGGNCIRYGLLSGFPFDAVVQFAQHKWAGLRPPLARGVYSSVTNLSYFGLEAEKDAAYMCQLDEIFIGSGIK